MESDDQIRDGASFAEVQSEDMMQANLLEYGTKKRPYYENPTGPKIVDNKAYQDKHMAEFMKAVNAMKGKTE
jgi:hypothetical protein